MEDTMLRKNLICFTIVIPMLLFSACIPSAPIDMVDEAIDYATISSKTPTDRNYYFDDSMNTLVYFAKNIDSGLYDLIFVPDGQEKEKMLSLPIIPLSFIIDDSYIYFYGENLNTNYPDFINPRIDPNYQKKLKKLKKISSFFGDNSHGSLFRANLETKEIQWLGSSITYLLDDENIYFMERPIDLDKYGWGRPKGDIIFHNSLCRMEKDGTDPILIRSEVYELNYITDKYIYADNLRLDKSSFAAKKLPVADDIYMNEKVYSQDKLFYSKWESKNDPPYYSVYYYDLLAEKTVKIAEYPNAKYTPGLELIPMADGGLIIWQSDSPNRETRQVAKIDFFDKEYKLEKTIDANGRYHIAVKDDKVFYILQEINDGKSIYSYSSENVYATLTLCSDDISLQGENITIIDVIDDSVHY